MSTRLDNIADVSGITVTRMGHEDGKLCVHRTFHDDYALEKAKRLRESNIMAKAKLSLHDNEDIRFAISCPSTEQWILFKRDHRDTYKLLTSRHEQERMKGARQIQLLHPEWVVQERL